MDQLIVALLLMPGLALLWNALAVMRRLRERTPLRRRDTRLAWAACWLMIGLGAFWCWAVGASGWVVPLGAIFLPAIALDRFAIHWATRGQSRPRTAEVTAPVSPR